MSSLQKIHNLSYKRHVYYLSLFMIKNFFKNNLHWNKDWGSCSKQITIYYLKWKIDNYLDFWKPGKQKNQLILLLGNLKQ